MRERNRLLEEQRRPSDAFTLHKPTSPQGALLMRNAKARAAEIKRSRQKSASTRATNVHGPEAIPKWRRKGSQELDCGLILLSETSEEFKKRREEIKGSGRATLLKAYQRKT